MFNDDRPTVKHKKSSLKNEMKESLSEKVQKTN